MNQEIHVLPIASIFLFTVLPLKPYNKNNNNNNDNNNNDNDNDNDNKNNNNNNDNNNDNDNDNDNNNNNNKDNNNNKSLFGRLQILGFFPLNKGKAETMDFFFPNFTAQV